MTCPHGVHRTPGRAIIETYPESLAMEASQAPS